MASSDASPISLMSWESFEQLAKDNGCHRELIEGRLQILPLPEPDHAQVAKRIYDALLPIELEAKGRVYLEGGYKLSHDPATWVQPDVSLVAPTETETPATGPDLAVEIVSPSEPAADLDRKVELLLAAGSSAVWVVDTQAREVRIFLQKTAVRCGLGDALSFPGLLATPLQVARFFED